MDTRARIAAEFADLVACGVVPPDADPGTVWVHLPWHNTVVSYPGAETHRLLRTFRNRNLVSPAEAARCARARVAVFGLSVGSNVVEQLVQDGIGGAFLLADPDTLDPTNLNRLRSTMSSVGLSKVTVAARRLSEVDPWISQTHLPHGWDRDATAVLDAFAPDVVFDEMDDLSAKAQLRRWAASWQVPLLMVGDIGEKSVLDVERHDLGHVRPFLGKVDAGTWRQLLDETLAPERHRQVLTRVVGLRHVSTRLVESALQVGETLAGMPQLGSTAAAGATLASVATRALLTGENLSQGTYVHSPRRDLRLPPQASVPDAWRALKRLRADRPHS